jgi:disulfide bond formation protein DsbB
MMHRSSTAGLVALILVTVLSAAAATPTAAQEAAQQAPGSVATVEEASTVPVAAPSAPLPGPRLSPEWPRVQPSAAERHATARPVPPAQNTIVISTLALVVIVVLAVLLLVD